jgi:hypothetical protein
MKNFKKGDRVVPSGAGRTATWPKTPGTVTRKIGRVNVGGPLGRDRFRRRDGAGRD